MFKKAKEESSTRLDLSKAQVKFNPFETNGIFHKVRYRFSQEGPLYRLRGSNVII